MLRSFVHLIKCWLLLCHDYVEIFFLSLFFSVCVKKLLNIFRISGDFSP